MFQLEEIKEAHSKVKSGADFPKYIQNLKKLGVTKYDTFVDDGHTIFAGINNYQIQSPPKYPTLKVENIGDAEKFRNYLKIHQRGQTDYPTFCKHSAETGVEKWTVDIHLMTCTYYDKLSNAMLEEKIPTPY
jgi:uncharacterized protein YbcV (DUF1398 family)